MHFYLYSSDLHTYNLIEILSQKICRKLGWSKVKITYLIILHIIIFPNIQSKLLVNVYDCFFIELFWDVFYPKQIIYLQVSHMAIILKYYNLEEIHYNLVDKVPNLLNNYHIIKDKINYIII